MKKLIIILFVVQFILVSCNSIRESAGVNRKNINEFEVIENPPLVIPPDFNLLPPEQIEEKNIEDVDTELAKEILFGLDEPNNDNENFSTMSEILNETNANDIDNNIRDQIDEEFANEKKFGIFEEDWKTEQDVLDSIKESERIRRNLLEGKSISEGEVPKSSQKIKSKKRRFFFF